MQKNLWTRLENLEKKLGTILGPMAVSLLRSDSVSVEDFGKFIQLDELDGWDRVSPVLNFRMWSMADAEYFDHWLDECRKEASGMPDRHKLIESPPEQSTVLVALDVQPDQGLDPPSGDSAGLARGALDPEHQLDALWGRAAR